MAGRLVGCFGNLRRTKERPAHLRLGPGRYKSLPEAGMCDKELGIGVFTVRGVMLFLASQQDSAARQRTENSKTYKSGILTTLASEGTLGWI